jgi:acetylglutamate kinase
MLTLVKIGGNILDEPKATEAFLHNFASLAGEKILVHGGGKIATQIADSLGIETKMQDGRRLTDARMLDVVTMVYGGLINKKLVARLQALGCNALGMTGADAGILSARKRPPGEIDYGFAGDIEKVDELQILALLHLNLTLIMAPLTFDKTGQLLNTNADTLASAIAVALAPHLDLNLVYCFEKQGVLENPADDNAFIPEISREKYAALRTAGAISKGMIPKLDNAFAALDAGVKKVLICHAENLVSQKGTLLVQ